MIDDYKYSLNRKVLYPHPNPEEPAELYGTGGPERTYGTITEVHLVDGGDHHWEYTISNSFTGEICRVREDSIFHGADRGYLDFQRRDDISWQKIPPETAKEDMGSDYWKRTLKQFVRTAVPNIIEREETEERTRTEGPNLPLAPGDYVKVRGDLRPEMETHRNLYAKILSASPADREHIETSDGCRYRVLSKYHVVLDTGDEVDIYDAEVKTVYTTHGRTVVLNWKAAAFLAEAFGDAPPHEIHMEYLNGHIFSRSELEGMIVEDLGNLLAHLLYTKGLISKEELEEKIEILSKSPNGYLIDQILTISRFNREENRPMTEKEIEKHRAEDQCLRRMFE